VKGIVLSAVLLVLGPTPAFADAETLSSPYGLASSPVRHEKLWVKVTRRSTLKEIADDLYLATSDLIALNDQSSFETILAGSWIAIPYTSQANLSVATRVSRTEYKLKPPTNPQSVLSQHPGFADAGHVKVPLLLASAPATQSRIWVKVSTKSTLKGIAADLGLTSTDLTALNDQTSFEGIEAGSWIVLPADAEESLANASHLDGTTVLHKAPLQSPPDPQSVVRIKANESLSTFSRDQGVSLSELRSLNPGLDLARLAIASEVRVAKASPRALLAIKPDRYKSRVEQACRSGSLSKRECAKKWLSIGIAIFEGTLSSFARYHNVSLSEIRYLNPGLDLARLHEGMEVRIAKPSSYLNELQQKREQIQHNQERQRSQAAARASAQRARAKAERARAENERMEREALSRINRAKQSIQNSY
jgi:LysM repeat protein